MENSGTAGRAGPRLEELGWARTPLGEVSLRRRWDPSLARDVYEIKLEDEFLMSSLFTAGEIELAGAALARAPDGPIDVAVGGLGLGYTAQAVLAYPRVCSLVVVEAIEPVVDWNRRGLTPAGAALAADSRCHFVCGDFFALAASAAGLDPDRPHRRFHAIVVDIDHSPRHLLHAAHATFYRPAGLRSLSRQLRPGGVFALWSNEPPDDRFMDVLAEVFGEVAAEVVEFPNPLQERPAANTIYLARGGAV